jgi:pilus assembly protein Flp/PilA
VRNRLARLAKDDSGASAVEYGLLTALVALGIIASLTSVNSGLRTIFSQMSATLAAH